MAKTQIGVVRRMKNRSVVLTTSLDIDNCAETFKAVSVGQGGSKKGRRKMEFFTPEDNSPFAQFERQPVYSVGVLIPKVGLGRRYIKGALRSSLSLASPGQTVSEFMDVQPTASMQMHVYDEGSCRKVELISPYESLGRSESKKLLGAYVEGFEHSDPSLSVDFE